MSTTQADPPIEDVTSASNQGHTEDAIKISHSNDGRICFHGTGEKSKARMKKMLLDLETDGSIVATVNALLDLRGRMSSIPLGRVIKSSRTAVRSDGSDRWTVINEDDVGREVSRITVSFVEHEGASREPIPTEETVRNGDRSGQTSRYIYVPKREAGLADEVVADDQDVKSGDEFVEESDAPSLSGEESVGEMKDMEIGEEEPAVDDTDEMSSNEEKVEVGHTDKRQKVTGSTTTFNRRKRGTRFTGLSYAESTDEEEDKLTDEEEDKLTDEEEDRRGLALDVHEI